MASISLPCPKCNSTSCHFLPSKLAPPARSARFPHPQAHKLSKSLVLKAKPREAAAESSSNSAPPSTKSETKLPGDKDEKVEESASKANSLESDMTAFMAEVSDLVKLVDTRDIVELQLKQKDCELIIRKKEALPQPPATAPIMMMSPPPQAMAPPPSPPPQAAASAPSTPSPPAAPAALPPAAKGSGSMLPPLKCPMAGTFYRSPAPGEPPFVKVGDKVQKGQVVCIVEAMKLMNEIEADQSGTIVEILAEDRKPISVDSPLLIIQP